MQTRPSAPSREDLAYQIAALQDVSRTFALTIPQLPPPLERAVGNGYLLCRIADTIEDDADLPPGIKREQSERFIRVVEGTLQAEVFAAELQPLISRKSPQSEHDLIANVPRVIRITRSLNDNQRAALSRCIRIMAHGMSEFQNRETTAGLQDIAAMDRYCYVVAGVVGEMLTELFCDYSPALDARREDLMKLAVSFGQGLQMTNILKDIWEDRRRGACWLPREVFARHGVDLESFEPGAGMGVGFVQALGVVIAIARHHLENALAYTLLIPPRETGLRRFCLWALGMAVLTLRSINSHRSFTAGQQVKISRRSVKATMAVTTLAVRSDFLLRLLFDYFSRGLPKFEAAHFEPWQSARASWPQSGSASSRL
jgi:farnesyl-diphosphate farnesyltransferase